MQDEIGVLIIEDEQVWLNILTASLTEIGYAIRGTADTFEDALQRLASVEYDIVLVDININGENSGIALGKIIHDKYKKPFIFVTANVGKENVQAAVEAHPSAYLSKPVHVASLMGTIQSAINNFDTGAIPQSSVAADEELPFLFVKNGSRYKKLFWKDVVFLRSEKNYTCLFNAIDKVEYSIRSTLPKTLQFVLPPAQQREFVQVNRAEAVQRSYITEVTEKEVKTPFRSVPTTAAYSSDLKKHIPHMK